MAQKTYTFKHWLRAVGFYRGFLIVSFIPVSTGAVVAYWETGRFNFSIFALTLVAVWAFHMGSNLLNDYYDHLSGTDDINQVRTPFSGGTRVIQEGLLAPSSIKKVGYGSFVVGAALFYFLYTQTGPAVLVLAAIGGLVGLAYSARPVWLCYRGLGELFLGLNFGPFLVLTAYYCQTGDFSVAALAAGLICGVFASAIITINEVPDIDADAKVGKNNLVVRFGKGFGITLWTALLWSAMVLVLLSVIGNVFPWQSIAATAMAVPIYLITKNAREKARELGEVVRRCRFTILSHVGTWILLSFAFFISASGNQ